MVVINNESRLLSAVLQDKQIHVLLQEAPDELFVTHGDVWKFIKDYTLENSTLPPPNIVIEKFSDFEYEEMPGTTKHHLAELKHEYLDSSLKAMVISARDDIKAGRLEQALGNLVTGISDVKRVSSTSRDIDVNDIEAAIAHIARVKSQEGGYGIKTGIHGFDNYLPGGILPGQFGLFLAYPGIGKSWVALYFTIQAWLQGKRPMFVSLEMSEEEVRSRAYTIMGAGKWSNRKLKEGDVDLDELRAWGKRAFEGKPPLTIVTQDASGKMSPSVVRGKIHQYRPDFVVLDYVQLMDCDGKFDSEIIKVKMISTQIKQLSLSEKVAILGISSATPQGDENGFVDMSLAPQLNQMAWSKQLGHDADWAVAFGRKPNSDIISCVYRKNRNGLMGEFLIQADFDRGIFKNMSLD